MVFSLSLCGVGEELLLVSSYQDVDGFRRFPLIGVVSWLIFATLGLPRFCRRRVDALNSLSTSIGLRGANALFVICAGDLQRAFSTSSLQQGISGMGVAVESSRTCTRLGRRRLVELPKSLRRFKGLGGELSPYEVLSGDPWVAPEAQASRIGLTLLPGSRGVPSPLLRTARRWLRSGRRGLPTVCDRAADIESIGLCKVGITH